MHRWPGIDPKSTSIQTSPIETMEVRDYFRREKGVVQEVGSSPRAHDLLTKRYEVASSRALSIFRVRRVLRRVLCVVHSDDVFLFPTASSVAYNLTVIAEKKLQDVAHNASIVPVGTCQCTRPS